MKTIISAVLALTLLGGATAANAAPFYGPMRGPYLARQAHFAPRHHVWMRGERFMPGPGFVAVNDWRFFRLRPPPFGFHWVRAGGEYLLVSNRGGLIADVIFAPY